MRKHWVQNHRWVAWGILLGLTAAAVACSDDGNADPTSDPGNTQIDPQGNPSASSSTSPTTGPTGTQPRTGSDGGTPVKDSGTTTKTDSGSVVDSGVFNPSGCTASPGQVGSTGRNAGGGSYISYVPASYSASAGVPLVVGFYGMGDTPANFLSSVWKANADSQGFIVMVPTSGKCAYEWCATDATKVVAQIQDLEKCYKIATKKRIVHGFSAGASMAYLMGLKYSTMFAGIGASGAPLAGGEGLAGVMLLPSAWAIPVSMFISDVDTSPYFADGKNRLQAQAHTVYWHTFTGGHMTNSGQTLQMYNDLRSSSAP